MFLTAGIQNTEELQVQVQNAARGAWLSFESFLPKLLGFAKTLVIALLLYWVGRRLIKWTVKLCTRIFERTQLDTGVSSFLKNLLKIALNVILLIIVAGYLGLETSSLVALVGSAGLTLGLALQGSLSNFAGGVLILVMKPFRVGDYIITGTNEGTVTAIEIFYTRLLTGDNRLVVIPNGTLSNTSITNVTNEPVRRLDLTVSIDYSEDIRKVKLLLEELAAAQELVLKEQEISVFVNSFDPSAIKIGLRVWVNKEDYWPLKWQLLEEMKYAFDRNEITIPFDQLDVNIAAKAEDQQPEHLLKR